MDFSSKTETKVSYDNKKMKHMDLHKGNLSSRSVCVLNTEKRSDNFALIVGSESVKRAISNLNLSATKSLTLMRYSLKSGSLAKKLE